MSNMEKNANNMIYKTIRDYGRNIIIYYTTSAYPYSGAAIDPINNEPINFLVSTASTLQSSTWPVRAVLNGFVGAMQWSDQLLARQGFFPDSDVRATCWLPDVLINSCSVTGQTYFDKSQKIYIDSKFYKVKRTYRTGLDRPTVIIVSLNEIEGTN